MAQPLTLLGLTLLLCSPWAPTRADSEMTVWAPPEVHGRLHHTVKLPCNLQAEESSPLKVTQITWKRLEPYGEPSVVAVLHALQEPDIAEPGRVEFAAAQKDAELLDASLIAHMLRREDEAKYTCEITVSSGESKSACTWLRVFYAPQVSISLYEDIGQQGHREMNLTCDALSNPDPKSYNWSTTTGPLPPSAVPQGSRLLIQPTEESVNTTFICRVSNDLGTGLAAMRVQLPGSPQEPSHSSSTTRIGLSFAGIVFVAAVGALVYSGCRRQSC